MKKSELERKLRDAGWRLKRHGARHDVWEDPTGEFEEAVPRHTEINEYTARKILKKVGVRR